MRTSRPLLSHGLRQEGFHRWKFSQYENKICCCEQLNLLMKIRWFTETVRNVSNNGDDRCFPIWEYKLSQQIRRLSKIVLKEDFLFRSGYHQQQLQALNPCRCFHLPCVSNDWSVDGGCVGLGRQREKKNSASNRTEAYRTRIQHRVSVSASIR